MTDAEILPILERFITGRTEKVRGWSDELAGFDEVLRIIQELRATGRAQFYGFDVHGSR
jgi:hypothetical protein